MKMKSYQHLCDVAKILIQLCNPMSQKKKERKLLSVTVVNIEKLEKDFPSDPVVKNLPASAGDEGLIPGP